MNDIMSIRVKPENRKWLEKQRYKTNENFTSIINRLISEEAKRNNGVKK